MVRADVQMLQFLHSIFNRDEQVNGGHSPELIEAATKRAIDATDSRLHALSDVRKRLRPGVIHAVDHVVGLVNELAPPLIANVENHSGDLRLNVLFSSPQRMLELLAKDAAVAHARESKESQWLFGLLVARMSRRTVMGSDMVEGAIREDVMQTVVSFDDHLMLEVTSDVEQTRQQLRRRAYDVLLRQILETLEERQHHQADLKNQQALLRRKLELLKQAGWSFSSGALPADATALDEKLQQVEKELLALGSATDTLRIHADIVQSGLNDAATLLNIEKKTLYLDRRNVERSADHDGVLAIPLQVLRNRHGRELVVLLVQFDAASLPHFDFLDAASRALA